MQSVHGLTRKCLLCANLFSRRALESKPIQRLTREWIPSAPTIHLAFMTFSPRIAPSLDKPAPGVFQRRLTPHSSALSTIFSCRIVRLIPKPPALNELASTEFAESTKRIPRKTCPSPGRIATPSSRSARKVPGINPSPHALSIGGFAPSATVTSKPFIRAAIATANPAGPPPMTSTPVPSPIHSPLILFCCVATPFATRLDVQRHGKMPAPSIISPGVCFERKTKSSQPSLCISQVYLIQHNY